MTDDDKVSLPDVQQKLLEHCHKMLLSEHITLDTIKTVNDVIKQQKGGGKPGRPPGKVSEDNEPDLPYE